LKKQVRQLGEELDKANKHIEFLSTLNEKFELKTETKSQKKAESPGKEKRSDEKVQEDELPVPAFKKSSGSWDSTIS
jgi:hypothetical protein